MTTSAKTITKTHKGYGGIECVEEWTVGDNGYKFLEIVRYRKGEREAVVQFMPGNSPWGRENAYMTPIENGVALRTRSYKDRQNARAKAAEFVSGC